MKTITHKSVTERPVNFERCHECGCQLPPGKPRNFIATILDGGEGHKHSFQCIECPRKAMRPPEKVWTAAESGAGRSIAMLGMTFRGLKVISPAGTGNSTGLRWNCQCVKCGEAQEVSGSRLRSNEASCKACRGKEAV